MPARIFLLAMLVMQSGIVCADPVNASASAFENRFRPMDEDWPTPNDIRTASGAPGPRYWQQKVDYRMQVRLDESSRSLTGRAQIDYHNNSPHSLSFLWVLLDQNGVRPDSIIERTRTVALPESLSFRWIEKMQRLKRWRGGFTLESVQDAASRPLAHTVVDALMRVDLNSALEPGKRTRFFIEWSLPLVEITVMGGRSGYTCLHEGAPIRPGLPRQAAEDSGESCIFQVGQWFPRLAAYDDSGWHHDPFLGSGEFSLEFGDYEVSITVPADHVVAATGELQNPDQVLTSAQRARLKAAATASQPLFVVTPEEAAAAGRGRAAGEKTWVFKARQVRDFAFASSRKYLWDAMGVRQNDAARPLVMAMSFYPEEARPLWSTYATRAMAHTLGVFGGFLFAYPYPAVQAAYGEVGGYENPMLSFVGYLPQHDVQTGAITYAEHTKHRLIGTIIHETGHNWFPMIVNSNERRWAWLDEGLTSFLEYQTAKLWDPAFPVTKGEPRDAADCMTRARQSPVMVRADFSAFGVCSGYIKPAVALVVLRESVMGRDLFDRAFQEYARRWRFKRTTPYDFFRTLQEVSGTDLGWFWRGWFYGTDHVDVALESIVKGRIDSGDPREEAVERRRAAAAEPPPVAALRNTGIPAVVADPTLLDFYDREDVAVLSPDRGGEQRVPDAPDRQTRGVVAGNPDHLYRLTFVNVGGLVTPIPLQLSYADGSEEFIRIPVQIWRTNADRIVWPYSTDKTLVAAQIDPQWETADTDRTNNRFPAGIRTETIPIENPKLRSNGMRDRGLSVTPDSVQTFPVPGREE